jgi:hypothetical protein
MLNDRIDSERIRSIAQDLNNLANYNLPDNTRDAHGAGQTPRGVSDDPVFVDSPKVRTVPSQSIVAVPTTGAVIIVNDNRLRMRVTVQNIGASPVSISFGQAAAVGTGNVLQADSGGGISPQGDGGIFTCDFYSGPIQAIADTLTGSVSITEFSYPEKN